MAVRIGVSVVIVGAFMGVLACASGPQKQAHVSASGSESQSGGDRTQVPDPTSPTSSGEGVACGDQPCSFNSDCCKGYACGVDPERSRVQKYCLAP
jgi:hypothetical protein